MALSISPSNTPVFPKHTGLQQLAKDVFYAKGNFTVGAGNGDLTVGCF